MSSERSRRLRFATFIAVLGVSAGLAGHASAAGPGLGSVSCEPFERVTLFDHTNGTPDDSPGNAFGHNVVAMVDGYLMLLFAQDSGGPAGGLLFYDVSDPRNPQLVRTIRDDDTADLRETHSLPVASAGGKKFLAVQTAHGVQLWDVTSAMTARAIAKLDLPGVDGGDYEDVAWQLAWQWPYLFVSGGNLGIFVVDTADPAHPRVVTRVPTSQAGGFRVGPIFAVGDNLVISNMDQEGQYGLLDISDARSPALIATIGDLPKIYSMSVLGDRIYGAGRDGDFLIHSFGPDGIEERSRTRIDGDGLYVSVQDGFVHYGLTDSYKKLDVHGDTATELGEGFLGVEHGDHGQTTPLGNLVFIGNDHGSGSALLCHDGAPDRRGPEVVAMFPADGATRVSRTSRISVAFSDNIDLRSVTPTTLTLREAGGRVVGGGYSYVFNNVSFGPGQRLKANTTYEIVIAGGGVKDVSGNAIADRIVSRFSTGASVDAPPEPMPPPPAPMADAAPDPDGVTSPAGCQAGAAGDAPAALVLVVGALVGGLRGRRARARRGGP